MVWGYFTQFWESITESVASVGADIITYPVSFFQNIGNAVAGAVGDIFDTFFHTFSDLSIYFAWQGDVLGQIFNKLSLPFAFIYNLIKNVYIYGFGTGQEPDLIYTFTTSTIEVFESIPYWNTFSLVLGLAVIITTGIATIKLLLRI